MVCSQPRKEEAMETRCSDALNRFIKANEAAKGTALSLKPFRPFPAAGEDFCREAFPKQAVSEILREGRSFLGFAWPAIRATDYMTFKRTGNRVAFEDLYFTRRRALNSLVLAEYAEGKGAFSDQIINGLFALCEESGWQLPAHNSYARSSPQLILPDLSRPVLDLFACETGAQLACIFYLLKDTLNQVSPLITKRIAKELEERIILPYLEEHFWWMGQKDEKLCNWTVWCTQNVLLTAFLGDFSAKTRLQVLQKAAKSCDYFLKDYGADGCCDEGAQYYRHAGLCLFNALDIMDQVTDGAFAALFSWSKIKNIAAYILHVHAADKYYFNFADCSPAAGRAGVREYLFGKRTQNPDLMSFAAEDFRACSCPLYNDEGINLFYRLQTLSVYEEAAAYQTASVPKSSPAVFYPSTGLFIAKSPVLSLAVKAGGNGDSHNHNDTGSFILYKNGRPVFVDIGVESYTEKTFSSRRYEIWTMQSCYHNLPSIEGLEQKDGASFCAHDVQASLSEDAPSISMELAGAYPLEGSRISYIRRITLNRKEEKMLLLDQTNASKAVLHLITYERPVLSPSKIQLGELALITYTGASIVNTETLPITDARLKTAWDHDLYRINLKLSGNIFRMEIQ